VNVGTERPLIFTCQGSRLAGVLHEGGSRIPVAVLVVVGGPQYRVGSHRQFVQTARALVATGITVLRFDYRGMGDSEGNYAGFERVAEDIRAAADALCEAGRPDRGIVLLGLCDAASAILAYCCADPRIAGLILMNPWVRTEQGQANAIVKRYYLARLRQADFWRKLFSGNVRILGALMSLLRNLGRASRGPASTKAPGFITRMYEGLRDFRGSVLLVQSGRDLTADEFRALCRSEPQWQRAIKRASVQMIEMPAADHTFSTAVHLAQFNQTCADWLVRTFGTS
jgi:exosortase A-associated hydrolase 1